MLKWFPFRPTRCNYACCWEGCQKARWMRNWLIVSVATVALAVPAMALAPGAAQEASYRAPRLVGTENPDLNGIWQALNTANWDLRPHAAAPSPLPELLGALGAAPAGRGVIEGDEIPYQPWAAEQQRVNFEGRLTRPTEIATNESSGDPEAKCYLPGVPRATYLPFPFQIFHTPGLILVAYEYASAIRQIHLDRQPQSPNVSWMGWSIGHWEGDTLVVDVTDQLGRTWLDRAGNFYSEGVHVVERYTPIGPDHLMYEATIEDSNVFTRPWTIRMPLYRRIEENTELLDFKCVEFAEEFMYGHFIEDSND